MSGRREFLRRTASGLGVLWAHAVAERLHAQMASRVQDTSSEQIARDESFWADVRGEFALKSDVVNLDHGWSNAAPSAAVDELIPGARAPRG